MWGVEIMPLILVAVCVALLFIKKGDTIELVNWNRKKYCINAVALFVFSMLISMIYIYNGHDWGGDFSEYISQAISMLQGTMSEQVEINTYMMENSHYCHGPSAYPWGFPLLLVPIIKIFGVNYLIIKLYGAVFLALTVVVIYFVMLEESSIVFANATAIILALNPAFLSRINKIFSDLPGMFFSVLSLYMIDRFYKKDQRKIWAILTAIACFMSYFVRSVGIASILTVFTFDIIIVLTDKITFLKKIHKNLEIKKQDLSSHITLYSTYVLLLIGNVLIFPSGTVSYGVYTDLFSLEQFIKNNSRYLNDITIIFGNERNWAYLFGGVSLILLIIFSYKNIWKKLHIIIYCLGTVAMIAIFPAYQGIRYLYPVVPWFVMFLVGAWGNDRIKKNKVVSGIGYALIALTILFLGASSIQVLKDRLNHETDSRNYSRSADAIEAYEYIMANTNESDMIEFFKPRVLWLNTGRKGFSIDENMMDRLNEFKYVLVSSTNNDWETAFIEDLLPDMSNAELVFENGEFKLYRLYF